MDREDADPVIVSGVAIPFVDLMWLLVKLAFAAIPATVIVVATAALFWGLVLGLGR